MTDSGFAGVRAPYGHQPVVWQILVSDADVRFPGDEQDGEAPSAHSR